MKKNLMSVVILALVLANLILTAILMISVLPQARQYNELVEKVCAAIDLDLEGGSPTEANTVPLDKQETYSLNGGESLTINLTPEADGVGHFALVKVTLGINTEDDDYDKYGTSDKLSAQEGLLEDCVTSVIGAHTVTEMRENRDVIKSEILTALRERYNSNFIVSVNFTATIQ